MDAANSQLPEAQLEKIYRNHRNGSHIRSIASLFMWCFAYWAYWADNIQMSHLVGITCSVMFLAGMTHPTLFVLRRITHRRSIAIYSLFISLLEVIGYTGIIYFLGGIEATYLTPIYAALITLTGAFSPRYVPFVVAGFAATAFGAIEFLSWYEIIPTFRVDPFFNLTPISIFIRVWVVIGLLLVVAYINSYTADRLKQNSRRLRKAHDALLNQQKELQIAYQDLKETQAKLVQSGKLASIGQLASGVAHELNQPLMVIRGHAQMLKRTARKKQVTADEYSKQAEIIEKNTSRMMSIIDHLRTFSRQSKGETQLVSIHSVIEDSLLMLTEQLRLHNIQVKIRTDNHLPKIHANANQLEQVFLNLITNARDAIIESGNDNPKGTIEITSRRSENRTESLEIWVRDTGTGIAPESITKVYDPFYTTKGVGKGTGLGLSICFGIIENHNGKIDIVETGPEGTTFKIELPFGTSPKE